MRFWIVARFDPSVSSFGIVSRIEAAEKIANEAKKSFLFPEAIEIVDLLFASEETIRRAFSCEMKG